MFANQYIDEIRAIFKLIIFRVNVHSYVHATDIPW